MGVPRVEKRDGVDEVADLPTRYRVARIIEKFTIAYPNNRYVVTSRIVSYTDAARLGEIYTVTTVRDLRRVICLDQSMKHKHDRTRSSLDRIAIADRVRFRSWLPASERERVVELLRSIQDR